ncbi:DUF2336 domain-containing protein [Afifella sp. JA880]|uniref:DUF2336 domain-containing protein n=1 Tax=Afifella sp. JA880 TaxID=2975280 RepID=UPI0021BB3D8A|nr:DUF2336 domain-containing protein [Afifella sp. JA880]MCT8267267.1 DUF2336 domain-containing protein [Afifella sp. JA880]
MIVERFLTWIESAAPRRRVEAASALARAFLTSELSPEEHDGLEAAMTILLDDPNRLVRLALAEQLADSEMAPHHVILALSADHFEVATIVVEHSPLLLDGELVDLVATREPEVQAAIARRRTVSRALAAAIAEVGCLEAVMDLLCNDGACVARFSLDRIVERYGHEAELREMLLARSDLPVGVRQVLLEDLADSLCAFVSARGWLSPMQARAVADETLERAVLVLAEDAGPAGLVQLVNRLLDSDQLTPVLLVRAAVCGQIDFFEQAIAALADMPRRRVSALVAAGRSSGLGALLRKAGLPAGAVPVIVTVMEVLRDLDCEAGSGHDYRRATRLIDAVLLRYGARPTGELDDLLALLRRLAMDAKRDAARGYALQIKAAA